MNPKNQMSTTDSEERLEDRKHKLDLPVVLPREQTQAASCREGGPYRKFGRWDVREKVGQMAPPIRSHIT